MLPRFARFGVSSFRSVTFALTQLRHAIDWDIRSPIIPGLFLGSLPIKKSLCGNKLTNSQDQLIAFIAKVNPDRKLVRVVSVCELGELYGDGFWGITTVSPEDWQHLGIDQSIVNMCDYDLKAAVDKQSLKEAVSKIYQCILAGGAVYIHCKAGCARSAMLTVIVLASCVENPLTGKKYTLDEAINYTRSQRKQIYIDSGKYLRAAKIVKEIEESHVFTSLLKHPIEKSSGYSSLWFRSNFQKAAVAASSLVAGAAIATLYRYSI